MEKQGRTAAARIPCKMAVEDAEETAEGGATKGKTKPPAWMFNDQGVAYAPWMVDAFDPEVRVAVGVRYKLSPL